MTKRRMMLHLGLTAIVVAGCVVTLRAQPAPHVLTQQPHRVFTPRPPAIDQAPQIDIDRLAAAIVPPPPITAPAITPAPITPPFTLSALLRQDDRTTGVLVSSPQFGHSPVIAVGDRFAGWLLVSADPQRLVWSKDAITRAMNIDGTWNPPEKDQ